MESSLPLNTLSNSVLLLFLILKIKEKERKKKGAKMGGKSLSYRKKCFFSFLFPFIKANVSSQFYFFLSRYIVALIISLFWMT